MSQKFRIKNDKGLFVEVYERALVSPQTIEGLRRDILPKMDEVDRAAFAAALDAFAKLPIRPSTMHPTPFDDAFDARAEADFVAGRAKKAYYSARPNAIMPAHGWLAPEMAKGASRGEGIECSGASEAGWLDIGLAARYKSHLDAMLRKAGCEQTNEYSFKGAQTAAKKARELSFEPIDAFAELASTEMWMLFVRNGFLDDKGSVGPLARARMFESAKAASKTANARGLSQWKVVHGAVELKGLEDFPGDSVPDKLAGAISMREGQLIREALQSAGVEALKTRLAELEAQLGATPEAAPAPARRSRL